MVFVGYTRLRGKIGKVGRMTERSHRISAIRVVGCLPGWATDCCRWRFWYRSWGLWFGAVLFSWHSFSSFDRSRVDFCFPSLSIFRTRTCQFAIMATRAMLNVRQAIRIQAAPRQLTTRCLGTFRVPPIRNEPNVCHNTPHRTWSNLR